MAPFDHSGYLGRPVRDQEHVAAMRAVVIPDSSPYLFPQRLKAPRGNHVSGHDASIVWFLRWAERQPRAFAAADLGWNEDARFALQSCVLNRYVARAGVPGGVIPQGWADPSVRFVLSEAGREVLKRAGAAERGAA